MNRPSRETSLMSTAFIWAQRSTCDRLHVGCVVHREGRILVQGYNGAPAGLPHCEHECDCVITDNATHYADCNSVKPCTRSVHAEQNAISYAARWGVRLEGASLSVTHQPCLPCAMSIINAGITEVYYANPYRLVDGINLLMEAGVEVEALSWAGIALDRRGMIG